MSNAPMICFDVFVNGRKLCRAGVGDSGVLSAILSWVGRAAEEPQASPEDLFLSVGGLYGDHSDGNAHPRWFEQLDVKLGDEVLVRIVADETPDEPTRVDVTTAEEIREHQRRYYEQMKHQFEGE